MGEKGERFLAWGVFFCFPRFDCFVKLSLNSLLLVQKDVAYLLDESPVPAEPR